MTQLVAPLLKDSLKVTAFMSQLSNQEKLDKLQRYRNELVGKPRQLNGSAKEVYISKERRKMIQKRLINGTQVICTTLSMSASDMLMLLDEEQLEYLIVDEACQSVELTNLIPFVHEPKKIILVGD